jgi:hypothetical protein
LYHSDLGDDNNEEPEATLDIVLEGMLEVDKGLDVGSATKL